MKKLLFILSVLLVSACSYAPEQGDPCTNCKTPPVPEWINEAAEVKRSKPSELCVIVEAQDAFYVFGAYGDTGLKRTFIGGYDYTPLNLSLGLVALAVFAIWGIVLLDDRHYKRWKVKENAAKAEREAWEAKERYMQKAQEFASRE
jgi:hypothetical protein